MSTNIVPRIALNRVNTFARTISPSVRLVRSSAAFDLAVADPLGDLVGGQPVGAGDAAGVDDRVAHRANATDAGRHGAATGGTVTRP